MHMPTNFIILRYSLIMTKKVIEIDGMKWKPQGESKYVRAPYEVIVDKTLRYPYRLYCGGELLLFGKRNKPLFEFAAIHHSVQGGLLT